MSRGTTTMNMISSTSTTSTSGVMLISDCRSEPVESRLSCMISLSLCAGALGDQTHSAEAGFLDCFHNLPDLEEIKLCIAPDHDLGVRLDAHRNAEGVAELLGCDVLIVDPQPAGLVDGDQDPASLVALLRRLRRLGHVNLRPFPHLWRHHHEND